jgi:transposase-like protein
MRVVLRSVLAGRETTNIMTKRRQGRSPDQIVRRIQDADRALAEGGDVVAGFRELNVTETTYYRWRNHSGGLKAEDAKKLEQREKRNLPLKKLLAEAELEKAVLKELA